MSDAVVYEVNLKVNKDILSEFKTWLIGHVKEMLNIEGFLQAEVSTLEDDGMLECCNQLSIKKALKGRN